MIEKNFLRSDFDTAREMLEWSSCSRVGEFSTSKRAMGDFLNLSSYEFLVGTNVSQPNRFDSFFSLCMLENKFPSARIEPSGIDN